MRVKKIIALIDEIIEVDAEGERFAYSNKMWDEEEEKILMKKLSKFGIDGDEFDLHNVLCYLKREIKKKDLRK